MLKRLALALAVVVAPLPPIPSHVPSALGPVPVLAIRGLACNAKPALGCFDAARRVIAIEAELPLVTAWVTLIHERVHVTMWDSGLHTALGDDVLEDAIADAIATARVAEMLRQ